MTSTPSKPPLERQKSSPRRLEVTEGQHGGGPLQVIQSGDSDAYYRRATAPQGMVFKAPAAGERIEIIDAPVPPIRNIEVALSARPLPVWKEESGAPPTLRAMSGRAPASDLQPSPRDRAVLTYVEGPNVGEVIALPFDQLTIGRDRQADLHVPDAGVSRKHARICYDEQTFLLEDLGSHNGTYVAGHPVNAVELRDGDVIRLGPNVVLRFSWMDAQEEMLLRQLYQSSVRDALTGAFNRRHFSERLTSELAFAKRHKTELSLLVLDIDLFKDINDRYGHLVGDRVLRELALVCGQQLRTEDTFARYGGEEFVVLLRGIAHEGAVRAAERLRLAILRSVLVGPGDAPVGVSIGCASLRCLQEPSEESLFRLADERLYAAKRAGRGRVCG